LKIWSLEFVVPLHRRYKDRKEEGKRDNGLADAMMYKKCPKIPRPS